MVSKISAFSWKRIQVVCERKIKAHIVIAKKHGKVTTDDEFKLKKLQEQMRNA